MDANELLRRYVAGERNFRFAQLRRVSLKGAELSGTDLLGADFHSANLSYVNLSQAKLNAVDLRFADLIGANLSEVNLYFAFLSNANLNEANLNRANLNKADLSFTNLSNANLNRANLLEAKLNEANLKGANLNRAFLSNVNLKGANLNGADLRFAVLIDTEIDERTNFDAKWRLVWNIVNQKSNEWDLSGANLSEAGLSFADLRGANLHGADLRGADLRRAKLNEANLSEADLRRAFLSNANLRNANLTNANLSDANLSDTDLEGANLNGTILDGANLDGTILSVPTNFAKKIQSLCEKVGEILEYVSNEEETKNSLILPFLQEVLGYDTKDPRKFRAEYVASFRRKTGSKKSNPGRDKGVDYAILFDEKPLIFIEAKSFREKPESHDGQMAEYYAASQETKIAVVTNGLIYNFFTDYKHLNLMDSEPFFTFNLQSFTSKDIDQLKLFHRNIFDIEIIKWNFR